MKVSCPSCQTNYNIDDKRIPPGGAKLKCARCQNTFPIKPGDAVSAPARGLAPEPLSMSAAVPLPGPAAPADPYAAYDDFQRPPESEATRVVALPVPSAAYRDTAAPSAAIPLPGPTDYAGTARDFDYNASEPSPDLAYNVSASEPVTGEAIPLPGVSDPYAGSAYPMAGDAVPLPGASDGYGSAGNYDYASNPYDAAPQADAVALPPPAYGNPYDAAPPEDAFALPPPPSAEEPYPYAAEPTASAIALPPPPGDFSHHPTTTEVDTFALPPPAEDPYAAAPGSEDPFGLPPTPAYEDPYAAAPGSEDPFALPPPAEDPYAAAPGSEDPFALPPTPAYEDPYAAAPGAEDPFALPPPAADVTNLDFSEPPPVVPAAPPNVATDFGDVDFGEPPPVAAATASIPDALEFDPTSPTQPAGDDLEADLSAPLPPPPAAGTADGLEMLSFIDDAAKENGGNKPKANVRRFHVRRRSGKVFGPFEEGVVVKMLEDGQLLGNEDVSNDADSWTPIGTVPIFATAIQKLMEGPGTPAAPAAAPPVPGTEPGSKASQSAANAANAAANMERLNQLYGGRMAAVAVVDTTSRAELLVAKLKKRLPLVIAAAAAVLVLGVGLGFGATRYGVFGLKKFFPSKVSAGSSEAADVQAAQKALLQDSFQSYKQARTLSQKVLASKEYPEVRALWCQAVFYLQRRYSAADPNELNQCRAEEEVASLELLGEKNVEYVKFLAGKALTAREPDTAIPLAQDAWSREANQGDAELAFLLAEAYSAKNQNDQAIETLKRVLEKQPDSVKAHHALGNLYQATGKADEAAKSYEAALKADATHIISALELAAVEVLLRKDAQKGLEAAERALDEKAQAEMGPAEVARARTLKGIALFQLFKPKEAEQELKAAMEKDPSSILIKANLARVLRSQRRFADALPFYETVAKADPRNLEYTDGHISTLVVTGKMEDAQKAVEEANKRFPGNARIEYLYGRIDEARDSNLSAEEHYQRAIKADAELVEANVYLGRFYVRLRRNKEAREQFELAASKAPQNAAVRVGLGELALAEENIPTAQEEFTRAVEFDPTLADAHLGLSHLALLAGDLEKAQKDADTALELDPNLKGGRLQRGTVLYRLGKLDEALTELEQAKKEDPRSVLPSITLGTVQIAKGNLKDAEANLLLALKSEPSNFEANFQMAMLRAKRGEYTQALESMKSAVDRAPQRADYRYAYGVLFREAKQPADAIEQWKQAVALDPQMADAHESLGQAYLESNSLDDAIKAFQATLKVDPKRTRALAAIGDAHFTAMRWREAIRFYEQALKAAPDLTVVFYKMARCYSEQGQHAKSIDWYVKATVAKPDEADAWYHLGYAYKEKGKKADAVKAFQEYLTRKPEAEDRKEIEDEISFLE